MEKIFELQRFDDLAMSIYEDEKTYQSYKEDGIELTNEEKWEIAAENANIAAEMDLEYLYSILDGEIFFLIDGSAGLWNGNFQYQLQLVGTINDIVQKILSGCDDLSMTVYKRHKGYYIEAYGYHHDGTNYYEFATLSSFKKPELIETFKEYADIKHNMKREAIEEAIGYAFDSI